MKYRELESNGNGIRAEFLVEKEAIDVYGHLNNARSPIYFIDRGHRFLEQKFRINLRHLFTYRVSCTYHKQVLPGATIRIDPALSADENDNGEPEKMCVDYNMVLENGDVAVSGETESKVITLNRAIIPLSSLISRFEEARVASQEERGIGDQSLKEKGTGLFVSRAVYNYVDPIKSENGVNVRSRVSPGRVIVWMEHDMYLNDRIIATARTKHGFVDLDTGRPIKPLQGIAERLPLEEAVR
jgi:acyl-CoA thioesterase FadM